MFKYRLITTLILIPIIIAVLFLLSPIGLALITFLICILSAWEWGQLISLTRRNQCIWIASMFGFLILSTITLFNFPIFWPFILIWRTKYILWITLVWWLITLLLVLSYPKSAILWRKSRLLWLIFGILIILPFFEGILALRQYQYDIDNHIGAWWLLYVMALVWGVDSGAYIFGYILGRNKLAPNLSPHKTWEGLSGGLITSAIIAWLFYKIAPLNITPISLLIYSILAALASILGDLTESMFKREVGVKDSSSLIPGHGGILDLIDSMTASIPIFTYLILFAS